MIFFKSEYFSNGLPLSLNTLHKKHINHPRIKGAYKNDKENRQQFIKLDL